MSLGKTLDETVGLWFLLRVGVSLHIKILNISFKGITYFLNKVDV